MKFNRRVSYVIIFIIFLLSLYGAYYLGEFRDISLNLASEVLGIFIAVLLIEKSNKIEAETKRQKLLQVVFKRLTIKSQLSLMRDMAKPLAPKGSVTSYSDISNENYYNYIRKLDFSSKGPGVWSNTLIDMNWADYITYKTKEFNDSISKIITNYALYLEPNELELMQSILDSNFMGFALKHLPLLMNIKGGLKNYYLFDSNGSREMIEGFIDQLWELAKLCNKYYTPDDIIELPPNSSPTI